MKEYKEDLTQRLCDMNAHKTFEIVELKQTLEEIREIAGQLYYHAIKDPVKREVAIYKIINKFIHSNHFKIFFNK